MEPDVDLKYLYKVKAVQRVNPTPEIDAGTVEHTAESRPRTLY